MRRGSTVLDIGLVWVALAATPVAAQEDAAQDRAPTDSTTVIAGPEYEAGWLHRALLGARYRDSWTVPVRVPVLDLARFGGGLTPVRRGGGVQTRTLRFEAPDGREYNFRSVNKTYSHSVPDWARGTLVEWLRQDQTSAQHPGAALVATPLLEASGLLHPDPQLYVMPDDPRLGEFREEFAGMLGTIEHHPNEGENDRPLFAGAPKVAGGERVLEHLDDEPEHRLDTEEFLTERLMSIFLGDWDRHIGQYRFARYERDGIYRWVPIPEDRDYAFVEHDGILPGIARTVLTARLITYEGRYQDLHAMLSNSADLVRRLLAPLDRAAWDSVAQSVYASLTDENIDQAVAALPIEWQEQTGRDLAEVMRARRAGFLDMSDAFYEMMAAYPEVHATDEEEEVIIERHEDASVTVRVHALESEAWGDEPYFERRFMPDETREIWVFLAGDDDRAVIRGPAGDDGRIVVRVVGGEGDDVLADSSGHAYLYDARGDNEISAGPGTYVDTRPYAPPEEAPSLLPNKPRHWGRTNTLFSPAVSWVPDVGLMIGGGPVWTRYGFRHDPFAAQHSVAALVNPGSWRGALVYSGTLRPENSPRRVEIGARASNSDIVRFHGFGNSTPALPDDSALTWYRRYGATGSLHTPWGTAGEMLMGAGLHYVDPEIEEDTRLGEVRPFGTAGMGEAGVRAGLSRDTRDDAGFPRRGTTTSVEVSGYLPLTESPQAYGSSGAEIAGFFSLPFSRSPVLALSARGEVVSGNAPVHRAAFIGGRHTLRGFSHARFAGDAAASGTAELRVPLVPTKLAARGTVGVSGFADGGRVWVDGTSDGDWHTAAGGAVWFTSPLYTVSAEAAFGEIDAVYLRLGVGL